MIGVIFIIGGVGYVLFKVLEQRGLFRF